MGLSERTKKDIDITGCLLTLNSESVTNLRMLNSFVIKEDEHGWCIILRDATGESTICTFENKEEAKCLFNAMREAILEESRK